MQCPKCGSKEKLHHVWAHNEPASSSIPAIFGLLAPIFYSAARKKYKCKNCNSEFRKHTFFTVFFLAVAIVISLIAAIPIIFIVIAFIVNLFR